MLPESGSRTGLYRLGADEPITDETGASRISTGNFAVASLDEAVRRSAAKPGSPWSTGRRASL
jgi:putative NADH-flavin reductase